MSDVLVIGATGKTGRRLVPLLLAGGHRVRAATRRPAAAPDGAVPVRFDWADETTHGPALEGAEAVYLVTPELRLDHAEVVIPFVARAREAGVRRVVFLSVRGIDQGPDNDFLRVERALAESGMEWTVLRPTWFTQNFTEGAFAPAPHNGFSIIACAGEGRIPFIDTEDIAAVAAAALTGDGHHGQIYDLSGPEAITFGEAARILGEHAGRDIPYVDVPAEDFGAALRGAGLPDDYAALLVMMLQVAAAGHEAAISDGVARALGREATSVEHAAARDAVAPATA